MSVAAPNRCTSAELLTMQDEQFFELIDGQLIERNPSMQSCWIAGQIVGALWEQCYEKKLGWVFPAGVGYQCFSDAERVRRADVSVILNHRLQGGLTSKGFCRFPPDLAVEVVSPNDFACDVNLKIDDWRSAGVPVVWAVWPSTQKIDVYQGEDWQQLAGDDELTADPVIPGFRCKVSDLFPFAPKPHPP